MVKIQSACFHDSVRCVFQVFMPNQINMVPKHQWNTSLICAIDSTMYNVGSSQQTIRSLTNVIFEYEH